MKRTRFRSFLMFALFATGLLLMGCSDEFSSMPPSNHIQKDAPFIQFIEKRLGTDWYGIYNKDVKVGYLKSTFGSEKGPNGTIYKMQLSGTIQIPSQVVDDEIDEALSGVEEAKERLRQRVRQVFDPEQESEPEDEAD